MKNIILSTTQGSTIEAGNVFETTKQYVVKVRYQNHTQFIEHPAVLNIKFCVIKIPTFCDSFFKNQSYGIEINGLYEGNQVYDKDKCIEMGLPLI